MRATTSRSRSPASSSGGTSRRARHQAADHIQNDLGLDSLGVMELVADVETRFNVSIPSEMFDRIHTVDDVAKAVTELQR